MSSDKVNSISIDESGSQEESISKPMQKRKISKQESDAIEELLSESKSKQARAPKKRNLMVMVSAMVAIIAIVLVIVYFVVTKKIPKIKKLNEPKGPTSEEKFAAARSLMEQQQQEQMQQFQTILNQKDMELHQLRQQMGMLNEQLVDYKNNAIDSALDKAEQEAKRSEPVLQSELPPKEPVITRAQWLESQKRRKSKQKKEDSENDRSESSESERSSDNGEELNKDLKKTKSSASEKVESQKRKTSDKLKGNSKEMDTMAAILGSGSLNTAESDEE